jgi:hypothetical protein
LGAWLRGGPSTAAPYSANTEDALISTPMAPQAYGQLELPATFLTVHRNCVKHTAHFIDRAAWLDLIWLPAKQSTRCMCSQRLQLQQYVHQQGSMPAVTGLRCWPPTLGLLQLRLSASTCSSRLLAVASSHLACCLLVCWDWFAEVTLDAPL